MYHTYVCVYVYVHTHTHAHAHTHTHTHTHTHLFSLPARSDRLCGTWFFFLQGGEELFAPDLAKLAMFDLKAGKL